jgi:hypothetical protein
MTALAQAEVAAAAPVAVARAESKPPNRYVRCGPGANVRQPRRGDLILVRGEEWISKYIRFFERMRYRAADERPFAYWSHAALIVSPQGHLVEVLANGVVLRKLEKYRDREYHYVYLDLTEAARRKAAAFALSCVRQKYGRASFVLLALAVLLGDRFRVPENGRQGCISLIARALQRAGVTFERRPTELMPADLAKRFGVLP